MSDARDAGGANIMNGAGAVYLFNKDQGGAGNWGQMKKIVAADRAADDRFGVSVAISDTLLLVGAPYEKEDANGMNTLNGAGSAYLFSKNGGGADFWGQVKKIVAIDRATNDNFGYAVSMSGNIAVVGAPTADEGGTVTDCGAVYIFSKDQDGLNYWGLVKKVTEPQKENADKYGKSLVINGTTLLVSAPQENQDPYGNNPVVYAGSAFFLEQNSGGVNQWGIQQKIALKDYVANQHYGNAVAMEGDFAVISGMDDFADANGQNHTKQAGAAWIFKNVNGQWTLVKKLVAPDRNAFDNFGFTVAINGPNIVVGAYLHDLDGNGANPLQDAGAAYIFNKDAGGTDNWGLVKKLVAYDRAYGTGFGSSVAISGSTLVAGAYGASEDATGANTLTAAGAAYVFSKDLGGTNNWGLIKKITPADRKYEDLFGEAAAMEDNYMVIGASACDDNNVNAGAAYLYGKDQGGLNNWGLVKKLVVPLRAVNDRLGGSIGISGTNIVIGVRNDDEDAGESNSKMNAGSAYIFSKDVGGLNNWGIVKKLTAFDRDQLDFFGRSVAISGNLVVVGANGDNENASGTNTLADAGSAYIFQKDLGGANNWGFVQKIAAADRGANGQFGNTLAISGNSILVGANMDDEYIAGKNLLPDAGSAYFFKGGCGSFTMSTGSGSVIGEQGSSQTTYYNNNCSVVASITASGSNPITGSIAASVWVETVQPAYYVLRHYEITPVINPETSTGRVMLFFTQAEFDGFNAINDLKLPTGPTDAAGKANLLIEKRGGITNDSTGKPDSYTGVIETINPAENDIVWNAADNRWEVSFDVTGFSGFFVKTTEGVLPLHWIFFSGTLNAHLQAELTWRVREYNIAGYTIEKSKDGRSYQIIGSNPSLGNGENIYRFTEESSLMGEAFYRIRQTGKQGVITYSPVLRLMQVVTGRITAYPNPVKDRLVIMVAAGLENLTVHLCDASGRQLLQARLNAETQSLDMSWLPKGLYLLRFGNGEVLKVIKN